MNKKTELEQELFTKYEAWINQPNEIPPHIVARFLSDVNKVKNTREYQLKIKS